MSASSSRPGKRKRKNQKKDEGPSKEKKKIAAPDTTVESQGGKAKKKEMSPVLVFAHGAGAPSSSDWMIRWKYMLAKGLRAIEVVTFDYPYFAGGKRGAPPKAEKLVAFHAEVVKKTAAKHHGHPVVLVGKSMGSRVSCMVAAEKDVDVSAVVCLGYPLKNCIMGVSRDNDFQMKSVSGLCMRGIQTSETTKLLLQGTKGAVRDETLLKLTVPTMFVQGSKDGLCPLEKLETVRKKMISVNRLHVIEGGDHSFKIGKKHLQSTGITLEEAEDLAVDAIASFLSETLDEADTS